MAQNNGTIYGFEHIVIVNGNKMKKDKSNEKTTHSIKMENVKAGDLMAFVYYAKVNKIKGEVIEVGNLDSNMEFQVQGRPLIERGLSADQFAEEINVTKTRAAEILISSFNKPFSVCFEKQDGELRTLRGRLITPEPLLGRSMVEDLDIEIGKHRLRQVDHRTIKNLIVDGVKYVVK